MTPFHFGDSRAPLFGVYHDPEGTALRDTGVLLCYPVGHEYMRAHRAFRLLGERLSGRGFAVLRFDYFGTGDSAGARGAGDLDRWCEDIRMAGQELRDMSGVRHVSVVGLRLGASLAARVCSEGLSARKLVLWDPVVSGKAFMKQLGELEEERLRRCKAWFRDVSACSPRRRKEFLGFSFSGRLAGQIEQVDLLTLSPVPSRVQMAVSDEAYACPQLIDSLVAGGSEVDHRCVPDGGEWGLFEKSGGALLVSSILQAIVDGLGAAA